MSETGLLALSGLSGLVLGAAYFAGLWWTVRQAMASKTRSAWFAASFALRAVLAVSVFWLVAQHGAAALLLSLGGFVLARVVATRLFADKHGAGTEARPYR